MVEEVVKSKNRTNYASLFALWSQQIDLICLQKELFIIFSITKE